MNDLKKYGLTNLSMINGGFGPGDTEISKYETGTNSEGCTVTTMESWVDKDGNGEKDAGETTSTCVTISNCPD
jgi:hypothetical protein